VAHYQRSGDFIFSADKMSQCSLQDPVPLFFVVLFCDFVFNTRKIDKTARYYVREALLLIVFAYSLMGEKELSWKDEKLLQDTILNIIMDQPQVIPF
jgi:hypothetical protein